MSGNIIIDRMGGRGKREDVPEEGTKENELNAGIKRFMQKEQNPKIRKNEGNLAPRPKKDDGKIGGRDPEGNRLLWKGEREQTAAPSKTESFTGK